MQVKIRQRIAEWMERQTGRFLVSQLAHTGLTLIILAVLFMGGMQSGVLARMLTPAAASVADTSLTTINYQGRLADAGGNPITDVVTLQFAFYDSDVDGSLLWGPEIHPNVSVTEGLFSVRLGSQPVPGGIDTSVLSGGDVWLETVVEGETLSPREKLTAVPYAMQAGTALTVPDGSITTEKIADGAVDLSAMGLAKYRFWRDGDKIVRYVGPSGERTTLDLESCSSEGWCCNAANTICYYRQAGEDAILEFSLENISSYACLLLHNDDDRTLRSKGLYYAVDGGNDCHLGHQCARLSRENQPEYPITGWAGYAWLCGW